MNVKKGQMSTAEKAFIRINVENMTPEEVATRINRSPKQVRTYLMEHSLDLPKEVKEEVELLESRHKLRKTMAWKQLKDELADDELEYFEEKYSQYMSQFKEDVLVTEETQIFLVIKLEIMMHRNSRGKRGAMVDVIRLTKLLDAFSKRFEDPAEMTDADRDYVLQLETQIQACKAADAAKSTEFIKLEEKHQGLLKDLKATRDQRVSRIESSKETFLGVVRRLQDEDEREFTGRHMELLRVAADRESDRLGSVHKFYDDAEDLPLLNSDTILAAST